MPELPEVESFRLAIMKEYAGRKFRSIVFHRNDIRYPLTEAIKGVFPRGSTLSLVERDGKQLVLRTEHGAVQISLGMSGAFLPAIPGSPRPHEHVTLIFEDGAALGYVDPRRFGYWKIYDRPLAHLADPLDTLSLNTLFASDRFRSRTRAIKDLLLDQALIGGVGNIYALEALYSAGIHPKRSAQSISPAQYRKLAKALPSILQSAIDKGGSTISTYRRLEGNNGEFQELHRVYDREGENCIKKNCSGTIIRIPQGGRSSWLCPECQK